MEKSDIKKEWWRKFIERLRGTNSPHAPLSPPKDSNYFETPSGIPGLSWSYGVRKNDCFAELYIKRSRPEENKSILRKIQIADSGRSRTPILS